MAGYQAMEGYALAIALSIVTICISALYWFTQKMTNALNAKYIPFAESLPERTVVVDCLHPTCPTLSHHRGSNTPSELKADTSTAIVLKAIEDWHPIIMENDKVTCSHFDMDGLCSIWAVQYPVRAKEMGGLLCAAAAIGDLREVDAEAPFALAALRLNTWVNTVERRRFYRPYEEHSLQDGTSRKYRYFLPRFEGMLQEALRLQDRYEKEWRDGKRARLQISFDDETQQHMLKKQKNKRRDLDGLAEFQEVAEDYEMVANRSLTSVEPFPDIGLVVIRAPRPAHYYALFQPSIGFDYVLAMYPGHRYELECKYTGYIDLQSRASAPRIDLQTLTDELNACEQTTGCAWVCNRMTDSGPLLRLESSSQPLPKAMRYGHPCQRPILASSMSPNHFAAVVRSYLAWALKPLSAAAEPEWEVVDGAAAGPPGARPPAAVPGLRALSRTWTWAEVKAYNNQLKWSEWAPPARKAAGPRAGSGAVAAVVVLGCKPRSELLKERVLAAAAEWRHLGGDCGSCLLVLTGYASDPAVVQAVEDRKKPVTEASAMADLLESLHNVPRKAMILEDYARNTEQNAINVAHILETTDPSAHTSERSEPGSECGDAARPRKPARDRWSGVVVVTSDWHIPRARMYFDAALRDLDLVPAYAAAPSYAVTLEGRRELEIIEANKCLRL